jgi:hypothetical protein
MNPILLAIDLTDLTLRDIIFAFAVIIVLYTAYKKIKEILNDFNTDYDKKKRWDKTADIVQEKEPIWDDAVADVKGEREYIVRWCNGRLDEIQKEITDNHTEDTAKIQEVRADVMILAESIRAVLEGLIEQGCNGPVKEAKEKLDHYLISSLGR